MRVLVSGASGRMGREVMQGIMDAGDLTLVGATDIKNVGEDVSFLLGREKTGVKINDNLDSTLKNSKPDVVVDFTTPEVVMENARTVLLNGINAVIGTTGIDEQCLDELKTICDLHGVGALVAPNFALGAVLMMRFAQQAAKYFEHVEIVELHHDQKVDAPSGTSIKTAEKIAQEAPGDGQKKVEFKEVIAGVRGGNYKGVKIHSVRLPGLIAHQEVIFGGPGQILTIRHDSTSRESFIPGVLLAIRKIKEVKGLVYGLENLLE